MADVRLENVTKTYDGNVGSPRTALTTPCDFQHGEGTPI